MYWTLILWLCRLSYLKISVFRLIALMLFQWLLVWTTALSQVSQAKRSIFSVEFLALLEHFRSKDYLGHLISLSVLHYFYTGQTRQEVAYAESGNNLGWRWSLEVNWSNPSFEAEPLWKLDPVSKLDEVAEGLAKVLIVQASLTTWRGTSSSAEPLFVKKTFLIRSNENFTCRSSIF